MEWWLSEWMQYGLSALFGALLAAAELVSRYRDEPLLTVSTSAGILYLCINALIGMLALLTLHVLEFDGLTLPAASDPDFAKIFYYQVVTAGLGGAAFFRTSVAKTKVGNQDIGIGPAFVIDALLGAVDRAIDRSRAIDRASTIADTIRDIPPRDAFDNLVPFVLGALQNLPTDAEKELEKTIASLDAADKMQDETKSILLGFNLANYVGKDLLEAGCKEILGQISRRPAQPVAPPQATRASIDDLAKRLSAFRDKSKVTDIP
ncbi:MAG: hypothetical protein AAF714_06535 [Pseudomonadota bacterium]